MKLIMENWRQYLVESERREKAKEEWDALVDAGKWIPREDGGFADWLRTKARNIFSTDLELASRATAKEFPNAMAWDSLGKKLIQIYNKHADRQFLDSLVIVHWLSTSKNRLQRYIDAGKKHQTSGEAYLPGALIESHWGVEGIGVQIKGWVVLGSNENLASGMGYEAYPGQEGSGFVKQAGVATIKDDILVYDRETFEKNSGKSPWRRQVFGHSNNEFIVDNWHPAAIVVVGGRENRSFNIAHQVAQENNLPTIDENQNPIEVEKHV